MRNVQKAAKRSEQAKGGGREKRASAGTTGSTNSAGMTTAGKTAARSMGITTLVAGTKSVRWGLVCKTLQHVADTVVTGCP